MKKKRTLTNEQAAAHARLRKLWDKRKLELKAQGKRLTQAAAAEQMGWQEQSAVSQYLNGRIALNFDAVFKFARLLDVKPTDIWPDLGHYEGFDYVPSSSPTYDLNDEFRVVKNRVPLISWVQAGDWSEIVDNFEPGQADEWIDAPFHTNANTYALRIRGDSMEPEFVHDDIIIVDPHKRAENGSYIVARLEDETESTFKQLQIDGSRQYLKPLNPRYPVLQVNGNMTICGVVRAKTKLY